MVRISWLFILLLSLSKSPALESAVCASRGKWSSTTDAAIVMGMSVWRDSSDASVASASGSVVVVSGSDGEEAMFAMCGLCFESGVWIELLFCWWMCCL